MILEYTITEPEDDELRLILDSWMRSSGWQRHAIERALRRGLTLVARSDGVVLGWLCTGPDQVIEHGFVKAHYRDLGVMRELWRRAGSPQTIRPVASRHPSVRVGRKLLRHLVEGGSASGQG